jgi:hypothetical protein
MTLSAREQRILAEIEDQLNQSDPALSDLFSCRRLPPVVGRWHVLSPARLGLLVVVLVALVLAHPLAARWGATGVGLLTAALVVPWLVRAARAGARRQREHVGRTGREDGPRGARWAALPIGLTVWAVVVTLVAASGVGFADAALISVAFVMLVAVHVARWFARRTLLRRGVFRAR